MARRSSMEGKGTSRGRRSLGSLNSTDVTAELFFRGHRVDRRRLANVADALWPNGEIRESPRLPRFYTPAQVDQVELALTLLDSDFGIQLEDLAEAAQRSGGVIETLQAVIQGRHEALDVLDQHVRRVASEGSGARPPLPDGKPRTRQAREAISA